jgi:transposase-like protein
MPKPPKYTSAFKVKSVLEALKDPDGISAYCRRKGLSDALIYKWQSQMIENADATFKVPTKAEQAKVARLEEAIKHKDQIIAAVTEEALELKKKLIP